MVFFFTWQPWIFTEVKEQRHWDITSGERFNILKDFVSFGLEHWGSDSKGRFSLLPDIGSDYEFCEAWNAIISACHRVTVFFSCCTEMLGMKSNWFRKGCLDHQIIMCIFRCWNNTLFFTRMAKLHLPLHTGWPVGCDPATFELEAPKLLWPWWSWNPNDLWFSSWLGKLSSFWVLDGFYLLLAITSW